MFLLVLSKNPYEAAEFVPDRLKFKQLLELGQLICSAGISNVYKPIKQGKELQEWVVNNQEWVCLYGCCLYRKCRDIFNIKNETRQKILNILEKLKLGDKEPQTAIFRYVKEYAEFTRYESNSELPINVAISEYKRYLEYKEEQFNKKRCKK